jgi:hypothetical protein
MQSNGSWNSMSDAPRDRPILLIFFSGGNPMMAVGRFFAGEWRVRTPHTAETVIVEPRRWAEIPRAPALSW